MECQRCKKSAMIHIQGKCDDKFTAQLGNVYGYGPDYVPDNIGIGKGDYIEFSYCAECGQIQGEFPVTKNVLEDDPDLKWQSMGG